MEVTHQADVRQAAIQFLRQRQEHFAQHTNETELLIPLRVRHDQRMFLLRHPRFADMDLVDTYTLARRYSKGRLPIPDKETAVALLLSCLGAGHTLPELRTDVLKIVQGRKFR
jgi:hypothetical protein